MDSIVRNAIMHEGKSEISLKPISEGPKILVLGVGGAGNNTVNRMARMGVTGADLYAINTDISYKAW